MVLNVLITVVILGLFTVAIAINKSQNGDSSVFTIGAAGTFVVILIAKVALENWLFLTNYTTQTLLFNIILSVIIGCAVLFIFTYDEPIATTYAFFGGSVVVVILVIGFAAIDDLQAQNKYDELVIEEADVASLNFNEKEVYKVDRDFAVNKIKKSLSEVPNHAFYELKTINLLSIKGDLVYVAEIGHKGYFKWNKQKTIPGYFTLSATDMEGKVKFVPSDYKYSEYAYFSKYASRALYKETKNEQLGSIHFELDDEGVPYYIQTLQKPVNFSSGRKSDGVATINLQTGKVDVYSLKKAPTWIDDAIGSDHAAYIAEIRGEYPKGSFNFSNEGKTTPNLNGEESGMKPVFINGKEYYFVEFSTYGNDGNSMDDALLIDARTGVANKVDFGEPLMDSDGAIVIGEKKYVEKKWNGVNPMLYNIDGVPTWIYSLLDGSNYHQRFVFVNAANHVITADDANLEKALKLYKEALEKGISNVGVEDTEKLPELEQAITIKTIHSIALEEGYVFYILSTTGEKFTYATNHVEDLIFYDRDDTIKLSYKDTGVVKTITSILE